MRRKLKMINLSTKEPIWHQYRLLCWKFRILDVPSYSLSWGLLLQNWWSGKSSSQNFPYKHYESSFQQFSNFGNDHSWSSRWYTTRLSSGSWFWFDQVWWSDCWCYTIAVLVWLVLYSLIRCGWRLHVIRSRCRITFHRKLWN